MDAPALLLEEKDFAEVEEKKSSCTIQNKEIIPFNLALSNLKLSTKTLFQKCSNI